LVGRAPRHDQPVTPRWHCARGGQAARSGAPPTWPLVAAARPASASTGRRRWAFVHVRPTPPRAPHGSPRRTHCTADVAPVAPARQGMKGCRPASLAAAAASAQNMKKVHVREPQASHGRKNCWLRVRRRLATGPRLPLDGAGGGKGVSSHQHEQCEPDAHGQR